MILLAYGIEVKRDQPIVDGVKPFTAEEQAFLRAIPEDFGAKASSSTPLMRPSPTTM